MKHYRIDLVITAIVFAVIAIVIEPAAMIPLGILAVLEVSLSFDNAVVNASVLKHMSDWWQKIFMTVGILIAVAGMRLLFPILIVCVTAGLGFSEVVNLALNDVDTYAARLHDAHAEIAMLGGVFLLMVFLNFMFEDREPKWLGPLERVLARAGRFDTLAATIALVVILLISAFVPKDEQTAVLVTGVISLAMYLVLNIFAEAFEQEDEAIDEKSPLAPRVGLAAFSLFMYLEFQDASFSFDGVTGAFAITNNIVLIAAGLGIGALFVRSMTVHLLRTNKLVEFQYLEHGAHWAIGALSVCLLAGIFVNISEYFTGLIGVSFIAAAVWHSKKTSKEESLATATPQAALE